MKNRPEVFQRYFATCIKQSSEVEKRPLKGNWFAWCEVKDTILFYYHCPYQKVFRRVMYRLSKNFKKNFGKDICAVGRRLKASQITEGFSHAYDIYLPEDTCGIDINFSVCQWPINGTNFIIRTFIKENADILYPDFAGFGQVSIIYQKIRDFYGDEYYVGPKTWDEYVEIYEVLYGYKPPFHLDHCHEARWTDEGFEENHIDL